MAIVTSLTEEKIQELMAGWEEVGLSQDTINALVLQLRDDQQTTDATLTQFNDVVVPQLQADVDAGSIQVSELNGTTIPNIQANQSQTDLRLQNLADVDFAALKQQADDTTANIIASPKVFVQPDEPPAYDDLEERDLVVGDTWHDSDDNNRVRIWNGVEWSTFTVDVGDFSLTARSFLSSKHQIY